MSRPARGSLRATRAIPPIPLIRWPTTVTSRRRRLRPVRRPAFRPTNIELVLDL